MQNNNDQISALNQLNEDLENYFANTIIPQLFVDADFILRKFTPPAMKQFNLRDEYIGRPLEEIKENFRYPTIIENIDTVVRTGKILEKEIQTTDLRWYQMNILPYVLKRHNRSNGVIVTFVDITPRVTDLKEQEKLVAEYELLLDTMAHDVKNPLFAIKLLVEQLLKTPRDNEEGFKQTADSLKLSIADIEKNLNDLIGSKWQRERYHAAPELLDLQSIVEDVRLAMAPQILETGAVITEDLQVTEIKFVRRNIRSVLYNLVSNAIKYTHVGSTPQIHISSARQENGFVISVRDNGIGMTMKEQQHIFEKFLRIRSTGEGSGVGLYLVNTIVTMAGGTVDIKSEPDKGSTFSVSLNASESALANL
jgi:two-component system phosphate regulon sensor histidine kinase PhoR